MQRFLFPSSSRFSSQNLFELSFGLLMDQHGRETGNLEIVDARRLRTTTSNPNLWRPSCYHVFSAASADADTFRQGGFPKLKSKLLYRLQASVANRQSVLPSTIHKLWRYAALSFREVYG
jgi:hypothetical protein